MAFDPPPAAAAWRHRDARTGFEAAFFHAAPTGWRIEGCTTAVEDGRVWAVDYAITVDAAWTTRHASVTARSALRSRSLVLETDGDGRWLADGHRITLLDGCLDVDLESSALTNALPVHRLSLPVGAGAPAPAAYVRAADLIVERLDQHYLRVADEANRQRYDYTAPAFGVECRLVYDRSGLVQDYPGLAARAA
jgi:hypothetical protein